MANSPAYEAACATHSAAYHAFQVVTDAYRAQTIGDAEYLAARAVYAAATAAFDVAFAAEAV